jgi:hypothetical protein
MIWFFSFVRREIRLLSGAGGGQEWGAEINRNGR